jgi:hypothetical protein
MATSWKAAIVGELKRVWLSIQGPDPKETIALYRERQAAESRASEDLVTATQNLVGAIRRLAVVTCVLVGLTVALVAVAAVQVYFMLAKGVG